MARRPTLPKTDAEMQRWSAQLEAEVLSWPAVTTRPMFGLVALYRAKQIFAALPRTRAINTPFSIMVKLPGARNDRLTPNRPGSAWTTFAMESPDDIAKVLGWLERAYEKAGARTSKGKFSKKRSSS